MFISTSCTSTASTIAARTTRCVSFKPHRPAIPLVAGEGALLSAPGEGAGGRPVTMDLTVGSQAFSLGFNPAR